MKLQYMLIALVAMCAVATTSRVRAEDEVDPGLVAEYFNIGEDLSDFPDVAQKKTAVKRVDKQINVESTEDNWPGTELQHQFYIRWTGLVKAPKDGKYKFYTESDDGSRLFVDGKQVVDNGGQHAMEEKDGEVELKAGPHEIKVEYFENGGGHGCKVSWETEGKAKEIIPESALWHKKGTEK